MDPIVKTKLLVFLSKVIYGSNVNIKNIKNHPFVDGNKRIGMLAMMVFLELNSAGLTCSDQDIIETGLKLAAGEMADKQLLEWILRHN